MARSNKLFLATHGDINLNIPSLSSFTKAPTFSYRFSSSAQELSQEIKSFINGVDIVQGRKLSVREHARCAVRLLRSVPACRGAVLEHLRGVYDEHVSAFLHNLETEGDASSGVSSNLEDIIQVCSHTDERPSHQSWASS